MSLVLFCAGAYLFGGIPTAYLAVKRLKGQDIRTLGSGNVGATNAMRVLGRGPGWAIFAADLLKGALPVALYTHFAPDAGVFFRVAVGVFAILGHVFTPYLGFRGGKGVATGAGVLCVLFPPLFGIAILTWIASFWLSRIVSLSSMLAAFALFLSGVLLRYPMDQCVFLGVVFLFALWTHRANIGRLMRGEEKKK